MSGFHPYMGECRMKFDTQGVSLRNSNLSTGQAGTPGFVVCSQSTTRMRIRLLALPLDSVLRTSMRPTSSVDLTWVPPSA